MRSICTRCKAVVAMATICACGGTVMVEVTPMQPEVAMVFTNAHNPHAPETEFERQLRMRPVAAITTTASQLTQLSPLGTFKQS